MQIVLFKQVDLSIPGALKNKKLKAILFLIILGFMLTLTLISGYNKLEPPDYAYHTAVINELKHNLLAPKHPFYGSSETSPYFTPYHVLAAIFARVTNLSATETMNLFGLFNVILLFAGVYLFTKQYYGYFTNFSLLFILLLWRYNWGFSGEYGFRILPQIAAFHSTFSLGMMSIAFYLALKPSWIKILFVSFLSAIAILSQPIISVAVCTGVILFFWKQAGDIKKIIIPAAAYLILVLLLLWIWPYYPVLQAFMGSATNLSSYAASKARQPVAFVMYRPLLVFKVMWPLILFAPIALWGKVKDNKHLLITAAVILIPYLLLAHRNSELTGRMLIYAAFMMQIACAHAFYDKVAKDTRWVLAFPFLLIIFSLNLYGGTLSKITRRTDGFREYKEELPLIARHLDHYDVVMTDIGSGYTLVGYSGKIVATSYGQSYVQDDVQRRKDLKVFFNPMTTITTRRRLLGKYNARYVLINKKEITPSMDMPTVQTLPSLIDSLSAMGKVIIDLDQLKLLKVNSTDE